MPVSKVHAVPKLRVHNVAISVDGYATGLHQREDAPFGDGLHDWLLATKTFGGPLDGLDDDVIAQGEDNVGAPLPGTNAAHIPGSSIHMNTANVGPAGSGRCARNCCGASHSTHVGHSDPSGNSGRPPVLIAGESASVGPASIINVVTAWSLERRPGSRSTARRRRG
jgi:hypothetical protein